MGVPERIILLGVFRTPNIADVLLLADLSLWPIVYSAYTGGSTDEILTFIGDDKSNGWAK
jgi:hypothetical protein